MNHLITNPKIAYINFFKYAAPNIENKLFAMAEGADRAGIANIDFININGEKSDVSGLVRHVRFPYNYFPIKYYFFYTKRYQLIERSLDLYKYDYIILRYCNGDPSGKDFFSKYKILSEHHTQEVPEYQSHLKSKLPIYDKISRRFRLKLEQAYGPAMLQQAKGIIGVTSEIAEYELGRISNEIPAATIPNGITVNKITKTGFKKFDGKQLDIVFVVSSYAPWHGIERLIRSIDMYTGSVNVNLHIIGNVKKADVNSTLNDRCRILWYGYKSGNELDNILKNSNIGISTLGLFHKGMKEACSLKTREYTARGLPYILAYDDPDLQYMNKNEQFFLKFPNDNSSIDFQEVIDFAESVSKKNDMANYMRNYALTYMDWSVKMKEYINFVEYVDQVSLPQPVRKTISDKEKIGMSFPYFPSQKR